MKFLGLMAPVELLKGAASLTQRAAAAKYGEAWLSHGRKLSFGLFLSALTIFFFFIGVSVKWMLR